MERHLNVVRTTLLVGILLPTLGFTACESRQSGEGARPSSNRAVSQVSRPQLVALGDSLTAGYGLFPEQAYPAFLQERLDSEGYQLEVVNAGVAGDTSAGGLRRLDWILEGDVRILIVALGGNDALRGLPASELRRNLSAIIERAKGRGILVLLAGMEAPPNQGSEYTSKFRQAYRELARDHDVVLVPFLLEGVAGAADLNQPDGIHPNEEGSRVIADNLWGYLHPLLERILIP